MKIAFHSDLHYEFKPFDEEFLLKESFDVLVLAGDIATTKSLFTAFDNIRRRVGGEIPIIFVPGNHDFYYGEVKDVTETEGYLERLCNRFNIYYGYRKVIEIEGQRFVCATGWTDFTSVNATPFPFAIFRGMRDTYCIVDWTFEDHLSEAEKDKTFLFNNVQECDIVVTHFAPTVDFHNPKFPIDGVTAYFNNGYDNLFYKSPKLWIYGHTHSNVCDKILNTIVESNQRGYPSESGNTVVTYDNNRVLEIN